MVGPVNENFELEPTRIHDGPSAVEDNKKKTSGVITSRKGFFIFGVCLVSVVVVCGAVVGASSSNEESPIVAAQRASVDSVYPANLVKDIRETKHQEKFKIPKHASTYKAAVKNEEPMKKNPKIQPFVKADNTTVCETEECQFSATNLLEAMDQTADPCDDFYQFACGGWYESHPVTNQSLGTFYEADDLIQERLLIILESSAEAGDPSILYDIRTHYSTCLDLDAMDTVGIPPLWTQLTAQGGWPMVMDGWNASSFVFEDALALMQKLDVFPFVGIGIDSDFRNTTRKILYFSEGGVATNYDFLLDPDSYQTELGFYRDYIKTSAKLVRDSLGSAVDDASIDQEVEDLVNFEIALAGVMNFIPRNKTDIIAATDIAGIQATADKDTPGVIDWLAFFQAMFTGTDVVITAQEPIYVYAGKYLTLLSTLLSTTPERTLANYLGWWWTKGTGKATTYAMRDAADTYQLSVTGSISSRSRSEHCVDQTNFNLGFPLSRAYVDDYFPVTAKPENELLVELIRAAFQTIMDENTWMAPEDLVVAKEKLDAIVKHVAYPDWIMDNALLTLTYQGLDIIAGEQYDNLMRLAEYYQFWNLETFRETVSKTFLMPPTVVNAFYDVFANDITILAGILQPPFYLTNSLAALNYGGIGMVIGHEFTHGFDNSGRRFDKDGNYASWWSQPTIEAFNEKADCFVDQYNAYSPPELEGTGVNMTVDGQQTLGENIADNGGIREAFRAYSSYVAQFGEEPRLPGLEQYTPNQLFYLGFANVWCEHKVTGDIVNQLNTDPHSPGRFRVVGPLSNDAEFTNTYNCPVGSPMNKGPDSCILW